jgi:hypothetical protein
MSKGRSTPHTNQPGARAKKSARRVMKFGNYTVGCGVEDGVERVLRENGRLVATMFENGEIEHEDHAERFNNGQQLWNMYVGYLADGYAKAISETSWLDDRQEVYKQHRNEVEAYYEFCFGEDIPDDLLDKIMPRELVKQDCLDPDDLPDGDDVPGPLEELYERLEREGDGKAWY